MKYAEIYKSELRGTVKAPCSKSAAHRALICAALAGGTSSLSPVPDSQDAAATIRALEGLGVRFLRKDGRLIADNSGIYPEDENNTAPIGVDCGESGSTLRFMIPVCAALGKTAALSGSGRLPERPLSVYSEMLPKYGVSFTGNTLPLTISGRLRPGRFELPGDISSQFITGLLLALPILDRDSEIVITTPLESRDYVNLTIDIMNEFGVSVAETNTGYIIKGGQKYRPIEYNIEGDWSQAAFFLTAGAVAGDITVTGLNPASLQGDREIIRLLNEFDAKTEVSGSTVRVRKSDLKGISIDASQIPDLVPVLGAAAAFAKGSTLIHSAARVRIKESDRLKMTALGLSETGIKSIETEDSLTVFGAAETIKNGIINGANDHRIVMAFAILAAAGQGGRISDPMAVNKSFPEFWDAFASVGGRFDKL